MGEFFRLLLEAGHAAFPFRVVWHWQVGLYYIAGKCLGQVGPGLKLVIPGLCDVRSISIVPEIQTTPLQTITLRDNQTLTYSASLTFRVTDPFKAYNTVDHFRSTIMELVARELSEDLAVADLASLELEGGYRSQLLDALRNELNSQCNQYGVEVLALGFNNFVIGVKTLRLLIDRAVLPDRG